MLQIQLAFFRLKLSFAVWFGFVTIFCLFLQSANANDYSEIGQPITNVYTLKDHGGHEQNWSSIQADNGLIYVGNSVGISEWDGEKWRNYGTPQSTPVRNLVQWSDKRIYIGTTNDIGYYEPNDTGLLSYYSLLSDWPEEQRQFGQVWWMDANEHGLMFITSKSVYFWNGENMQIVDGVTPGFSRVFATNDRFLIKAETDSVVTEIIVEESSLSNSRQTNFKIATSPLDLPSNTTIRKIFYNKKQNLVVVTRFDGVFEYIAGETVNRVSAKEFGTQIDIYNAIQASDGYYYLSSFQSGLFILDESLQLLRQYGEKDSTSLDTVFSAMEDRQGNIWLTGVPNIVKMVPAHRYSRFRVGNTSTTVTGLSKRECGERDCVIAVGNGVFELTSHSTGVKSPVFERLMPSKKINIDFIEYENYQLYSGRSGIFYRKKGEVGDFKKLINVDLGRNLRIEPVTNTLFALSVNDLFTITKEENQLSFKKVEHVEGELHTLEIDSNGIVWVGTALQSLYRVENAQYNDKKTSVQMFDKTNGLPAGKIIPYLLSDSTFTEGSSNAHFATQSGLLSYQNKNQRNKQHTQNNLKSPIFKDLNLPEVFKTDGQAVNYIYDESLYNPQQKRIWYQVGNASGFTKKDEAGNWQHNESVFQAFDDKKVIDLFISQNNILWFALITGEVFRVNVDLATPKPNKGKLNIRHIEHLISNRSINRAESGVELLLDQQSNSIRIHFSLADNSYQSKTRYRHRLLGSNNTKWTNWSTENYSDYTQLSGADYTFQLEAKDPWGRLSQAELSFSVLPVWYLSQFAMVVYVFIAICILVATSWFTQKWRTKKLQERNVKLEATIVERTREVNDKVKELKEQQALKDRFFSNVSHEFRTPLTLTIGPLETVLSEHNNGINNQVASLTQTALNNANKMLALVGQVLDLNRLEVGKLPIRVSQYDIAALLRSLQYRFEPWAQQENQTIVCENCEEPLNLFFDQDQIDRCISNLLSNAIKYSGKNSHIIIRLTNEEQSVRIEIIDNGFGISEQAKNKVFERFYQDENSERNTAPGTGIGLSLVKELMELHHGHVHLTTQIGEGCCFSLNLQKGRQHFNDTEIVEPIALDNSDIFTDKRQFLETTIESDQSEDVTTLLVVDDNEELRNFIGLRLSANYQIIQAENGKEGFELACKHLPDLIISDVMMPVMTGYELSEKIKGQHSTRSIPVILLTAKASKREIVEGFSKGADDYLSKPFDTSELIMRVNAQINSRKIIRETIVFEQTIGQLVEPQKTSFADKIRGHVLDNLSKPEYSVEDLAKQMFMSRATLSRKCKDELDMSPRTFIIEQRMQQAIYLIQERAISISEIAYAVGFESLSYFSKSFKKHTGKSPSEFATS